MKQSMPRVADQERGLRSVVFTVPCPDDVGPSAASG